MPVVIVICGLFFFLDICKNIVTVDTQICFNKLKRLQKYHIGLTFVKCFSDGSPCLPIEIFQLFW
jgi:hypothetical protein